MNEHLRDRILRHLDTLSDERGYQVLDYVEFLESKYAERQSPGANVISKLTEAVEDKLRAGRVSATVIGETMGFLNRASNVLSGAMAAGKSVANDVVNVARQAAASASTPASPSAESSATAAGSGKDAPASAPGEPAPPDADANRPAGPGDANASGTP
ncbi:MAG TPA: hypothetical protein VG818_12970 [Gemmatimonadaceae bacterium]|nr:hypothetical protein [Gemmatimonadaceae bacterium]